MQFLLDGDKLFQVVRVRVRVRVGVGVRVRVRVRVRVSGPRCSSC